MLKSFRLEVIVRTHEQTHSRPIVLPGPQLMNTSHFCTKFDVLDFAILFESGLGTAF